MIPVNFSLTRQFIRQCNGKNYEYFYPLFTQEDIAAVCSYYCCKKVKGVCRKHNP